MPIRSLLTDKESLDSRVVVIDVYRSSNTVISLLERGAKRIVPVESLDMARALKDKNPDWLFLGERGGIKVEGAEGDNSPTQPLDVQGKTLILTTSGGTRCLDACNSDKTVYMGSFANAAMLINHLRETENEPVSFWAVGVKAEKQAEEDELCAAYLEALFQSGSSPNQDTIRQKLLACTGADRLRTLKQDDDLAYCTQFDHSQVIPVRCRMDDGTTVLERLNQNV